jgi:hypothetical protein
VRSHRNGDNDRFDSLNVLSRGIYGNNRPSTGDRGYFGVARGSDNKAVIYYRVILSTGDRAYLGIGGAIIKGYTITTTPSTGDSDRQSLLRIWRGLETR